ncbi:response regulator [Azospirillum argentinense]|uniref:Response regulator n=1 Tax=Azospirillum brasilense TaxID=192 RepID=A0A4D8Q7Y6_AZOBR|nr:response regulator [Azospirillum argentinense]QCO05361.1 response regulator [Azospirillum argentinense]
MTNPINRSPRAGADGTAPAAATTPVRVLVVEDETIVAMYLTDMLEELSYEVCGVAANAADALKIAERERPALALVDIGLAGPQDGIETAQALRERFAVGSIFMSGASDPVLLERARAAGPHGFIQKPYDERQLKTLLNNAAPQH